MAKISHYERVLIEKKAIENEKKYRLIEQGEISDQRRMLVVKANSMIQKSRFSLNLQEQRIVLYLVSKIKPNQKRFEEYEFSIIEFCKVCNIEYKSGSGVYAYIKTIIQTLADKSLWVEIDPGTETLVRWISKAKIKKGSGKIIIKFDDDLMPYLLHLKNQYTMYALENVLAMKSKYGVRLYEILKSYAYIGKHTFSIDEFRKRVGAEAKSYDNISLLRKKVIEPALEDIAKYGDIQVSYLFVKKEKKITHIIFIIDPLDTETNQSRLQRVYDYFGD